MGSWIVWLVLAAVLGVAEVLTTTLAFGLIGAGAMVAALVGRARRGPALPAGCLRGRGRCAGGGWCGRSPSGTSSSRHHCAPGPRLSSGRSAKVVEEVTGGGGQVRIGGEGWSARPYDESQVIPVGSP